MPINSRLFNCLMTSATVVSLPLVSVLSINGLLSSDAGSKAVFVVGTSSSFAIKFVGRGVNDVDGIKKFMMSPMVIGTIE